MEDRMDERLTGWGGRQLFRIGYLCDRRHQRVVRCKKQKKLNISLTVQLEFLLPLFDLTVWLSQELDQPAKD